MGTVRKIFFFNESATAEEVLTDALDKILDNFDYGLYEEYARTRDDAGKWDFFNENDAQIKDRTMFSKTSIQIENLFDQAVTGDLTGKPVSIGKLTKAGKEYLETISGLTLKEDVDFVLNPSDLLHIYNNHYGENEKDKGNNIPLNKHDIRRLVDVVAFPTKIVYGIGENGRKSFYFLMDTPGGAYNLLEIYADKRGNLSSKTYYKTKKGVSQRVMNILNSLHSTSVADGATLSNAKVPQMFENPNIESENSAENDVIRFSARPAQTETQTDEEVSFSFIGERGAVNLDRAEEATTRLDNLGVAREMEQSGKEPLLVKMATGWERGADGKWRYEVMDGVFDVTGELHPERRSLSAEERAELDGAFDELMEAFEKGSLAISEDKIGESSMADIYVAGGMERSRAERLAALEDKEDAVKHTPKYLDDYLEQEELFAAYPELRDIKLVEGDSNLALFGEFGSYNPQTKTITLNDLSYDTLLHEVQHIIQHIEGFAVGGSKKTISAALRGNRHVRNEVDGLLNSLGYNEWLKSATPAELSAEMVDGRSFNAGYAFSHSLPPSLGNALRDKLDEANRAIEHNNRLSGGERGLTPQEQYNRLSGEVEARNAQRRMNMSADERRHSLANETEDVAREDQIFIYDALANAEENVSFSKSPSEFDDIAKEEADIIAAAKKNGTYLKALNKQPTNLTPKRWVQVRTKAFKKWFGDWEKAFRVSRLRTSETASIAGNEISKGEITKKEALEYGKKLQGEYINKDTGNKIQLQRGRKNGGVNEVLQHNYKDQEHLKSIAAIPQIIEKSIFIEGEDNKDKQKSPNVSEYQHYVCGLKIGDIDYTVHSIVAVDLNGDRYYDHNLTQIEKTKLLDLIDQAVKDEDFGTTPDTKSTILSGYKGKKLLSLLQTNSSKVVDENGEPRVVYHGTTRDKEIKRWNEALKYYDITHEPFYVFKRKVDGERNNGFFFNSDQQNAYDYGHNTYDTFLNLKNPLVIDSQGASYSAIEYNNEIKDTYEWSEYAEGNGFDGVIFNNIRDGVDYNAMSVPTTDYVAFRSNQIKSATENVGTFSEEDEDIRFSVKGTDEEIDEYAEKIKSQLPSIPNMSNEDLENLLRMVGRLKASATKGYGRISEVQRAEKATIYGLKKDAVEEIAKEWQKRGMDVAVNGGVIYFRTPAGVQISFHSGLMEYWSDEIKRDSSLEWDGVKDAWSYRDMDAYNKAKTRYKKALNQYKTAEESDGIVLKNYANKIREALKRIFSRKDTRAKYGLPESKEELFNTIDKEIYQPRTGQIAEETVRHILSGYHIPYNTIGDITWRVSETMGFRSPYELLQEIRSQLKNPYAEDFNADTLQLEEAEDIQFSRESASLADTEAVNERFNEELQQQIDGTLPQGHIYRLGLPGAVLKSTGIPELPIQLSASKLNDKATNYGHDYNLDEIKDLVKALNEPLAIFAYGDKTKAQNIAIEIQSKNKNFVVGLALRPKVGGIALEINSIRNVFPKDNAEWLNWIAQGKTLYLDKEKIQTLIAQQRTNLADVGYLDLNYIANIIKSFENPQVSEVKNEEEISFSARPAQTEAQMRYERSVRDTLAHRISEAYFDGLRAVESLVSALERSMGTKVQGRDNVYKQMLALSSRNQWETDMMTAQLIDPLAKQMQRIIKGQRLNGRKMTLDDVEIYLNCKHAIERNALMAQREADRLTNSRPDLVAKNLAKGMTQQDAEDAADDYIRKGIKKARKDYSGLTEIFAEPGVTKNVDRLENEALVYAEVFENTVGQEGIRDLWDCVKALTDFSLQKSYISGMLTLAQYNEIRGMYTHYVPLRGWHTDAASDVYEYLGRGGSGRVTPAVKEAKGRKSRAADIFGTMCSMAPNKTYFFTNLQPSFKK